MTNKDQNQNPDNDQNSNPNADPNQNPDSSSNDLKPLTEEEMASMTTEEITAHAEKLEAQIKNGNKQTPDQIRENQMRRAMKAQEKLFANNNQPNNAPNKNGEGNKEVAQADLLTLAKTDFDLGSDQQKVLQWYVETGKVASYKEALEHPAVKAELEALNAESNAAAVINENDSDDVKLRTKKEAIAHAKATGEIPDDPELKKAIVEDNLRNMSSLR